MRLWVTRPEPDASEMAATLRARGHEVLAAPLLVILPVAGATLPVAGVTALVATSRNGLRALAGRDALQQLAPLPLFAVGGATAREARAIGFQDVTEGEGHARSLVAVIARRFPTPHGTLLHLAGETLACDLTPSLEALGFRVARPVLYRSVAADRLPDAASAAIVAGALDGVILMSPRTAAIHADLITAGGLAVPARALRHFCLSQAVAERLVALAPTVTMLPRKPTSEELLALVEEAAAQSTASCRPGKQ
jgi:uroporphyrinogen-III synthase